MHHEDVLIWEHARGSGLLLVTKDEDFIRLSVARGAPPKVIYIALGNCAVADVESLLRSSCVRIEEFVADDEESFLILD